MGRDLNTGLGISFTPGLQEGLINNRGVQMIHEYAVSCTCRVEDVYAGLLNDGKDRRREPFCARCGTDGWLFRSPALVTGIVTSVRHQRNILDAGTAQAGDAMFSPTPNDVTGCGETARIIGAHDKLTATWPEPLDDGQVLIRGYGSKANGAGVKTELEDEEDRLWYEPASSIWCEDENGTEYKEDVDFTLGPGKIIKWAGKQPGVGVVYTLKYNAFFEWVSFQSPNERRDRSAANLGELVFLRKKHIVLVNSSPYATSEDKKSLQAFLTC